MTFILTLAAYHFSLSLCFCDSWSLGFSLSVHVFFVRLFVWLSFCQSLYSAYEKAIRPVRLPPKFFSVSDPSFQIQFSAKLFCLLFIMMLSIGTKLQGLMVYSIPKIIVQLHRLYMTDKGGNNKISEGCFRSHHSICTLLKIFCRRV